MAAAAPSSLQAAQALTRQEKGRLEDLLRSLYYLVPVVNSLVRNRIKVCNVQVYGSSTPYVLGCKRSLKDVDLYLEGDPQKSDSWVQTQNTIRSWCQEFFMSFPVITPYSTQRQFINLPIPQKPDDPLHPDITYSCVNPQGQRAPTYTCSWDALQIHIDPIDWHRINKSADLIVSNAHFQSAAPELFPVQKLRELIAAKQLIIHPEDAPMTFDALIRIVLYNTRGVSTQNRNKAVIDGLCRGFVNQNRKPDGYADLEKKIPKFLNQHFAHISEAIFYILNMQTYFEESSLAEIDKAPIYAILAEILYNYMGFRDRMPDKESQMQESLAFLNLCRIFSQFVLERADCSLTLIECHANHRKGCHFDYFPLLCRAFSMNRQNWDFEQLIALWHQKPEDTAERLIAYLKNPEEFDAVTQKKLKNIVSLFAQHATPLNAVILFLKKYLELGGSDEAILTAIFNRMDGDTASTVFMSLNKQKLQLPHAVIKVIIAKQSVRVQNRVILRGLLEDYKRSFNVNILRQAQELQPDADIRREFAEAITAKLHRQETASKNSVAKCEVLRNALEAFDPHSVIKRPIKDIEGAKKLLSYLEKADKIEEEILAIRLKEISLYPTLLPILEKLDKQKFAFLQPVIVLFLVEQFRSTLSPQTLQRILELEPSPDILMKILVIYSDSVGRDEITDAAFIKFYEDYFSKADPIPLRKIKAKVDAVIKRALDKREREMPYFYHRIKDQQQAAAFLAKLALDDFQDVRILDLYAQRFDEIDKVFQKAFKEPLQKIAARLLDAIKKKEAAGEDVSSWKKMFNEVVKTQISNDCGLADKATDVEKATFAKEAQRYLIGCSDYISEELYLKIFSVIVNTFLQKPGHMRQIHANLERAEQGKRNVLVQKLYELLLDKLDKRFYEYEEKYIKDEIEFYLHKGKQAGKHDFDFVFSHIRTIYEEEKDDGLPSDFPLTFLDLLTWYQWVFGQPSEELEQWKKELEPRDKIVFNVISDFVKKMQRIQEQLQRDVIDPDNMADHYLAGAIYKEKGNLERSLQMYRLIFEDAKRTNDVDNMVKSAIRIGRLLVPAFKDLGIATEVMVVLVEAFKVRQNDSELASLLIVCLSRLGKVKQMCGTYDRYNGATNKSDNLSWDAYAACAQSLLSGNGGNLDYLMQGLYLQVQAIQEIKYVRNTKLHEGNYNKLRKDLQLFCDKIQKKKGAIIAQAITRNILKQIPKAIDDKTDTKEVKEQLYQWLKKSGQEEIKS